MENREAVIDADFFNNLTEKDRSGGTFLSVMSGMCVKPVMHRYVVEEELMGNSTLQCLIDNGSIAIRDYSDFITEQNKQDYIDLFNMAYKMMNYKTFSEDPFTYRRCKENLGEIRSSLMAWFLNIEYFMTDDGQAKQFVCSNLNNSRRKINVYNIYDIFMNIDLSTTSLKWSNIKPILNTVFEKRQKLFDEIRNRWVKN